MATGKRGGKARPATHSDDGAATRVDPAQAVRDIPDGDEPYRDGDFMGQPLHRCPYCPETRVTHDAMVEHVARHIAPEPPVTDRAAAAGIILPGENGGADQ